MLGVVNLIKYPFAVSELVLVLCSVFVFWLFFFVVGCCVFVGLVSLLGFFVLVFWFIWVGVGCGFCVSVCVVFKEN